MNDQNNENLLPKKESSRWQLTQPYNSKKHSVLIFLIQIFYCVSVFVITLLGIYFLIESPPNDSKNQFEEIAKNWNITLRHFQKFTISASTPNKTLYLLPTNKPWHSDQTQKEIKEYPPLVFKSENFNELLSSSTISKKNSYINNDNYNLTTSFSLNISGTLVDVEDIDVLIKIRTHFSEEQCSYQRGIYNEETDTCYQYYFLKTLCFIVNTTSRTLIDDFQVFKCNQFTPWYESFKLAQWNFSNVDPGIEEIAKNGIEVKVGAAEDPYVWLSYNNEDTETSINDYSTIGIWFIIIALGLIAMGFFFYFKENSEREIKRIGSNKEKEIQMTEEKSQLKEKEIPVPNPVLK